MYVHTSTVLEPVPVQVQYIHCRSYNIHIVTPLLSPTKRRRCPMEGTEWLPWTTRVFAWRWNSAGALSTKRCGLVAEDGPRHANVKIYEEMVRGVLWTDSWNNGHGHAETSATVNKPWETNLHEWLQHSIEIHLLKDGYKVMYNTHHMVYIEFRRLTRFQNFMPSLTILFAKTRIWGIFVPCNSHSLKRATNGNCHVREVPVPHPHIHWLLLMISFGFWN